jgi:hypothetical protein
MVLSVVHPRPCRGTDPEESISSVGYICNFSDLEVHSILLDDIMRVRHSLACLEFCCAFDAFLPPFFS